VPPKSRVRNSSYVCSSHLSLQGTPKKAGVSQERIELLVRCDGCRQFLWYFPVELTVGDLKRRAMDRCGLEQAAFDRYGLYIQHWLLTDALRVGDAVRNSAADQAGSPVVIDLGTVQALVTRP
jgi:hypothetical protein